MTLSGLPSDRFMFCGFLPPIDGAPHRLRGARRHRGDVDLLRDGGAALRPWPISAVLGERRIAIARELTKLHEEVLSGTPGALQAVIASTRRPQGRALLLVEPADPRPDGATRPRSMRLSSRRWPMLPSQAVAAIARRYGFARQDVYRRAIALQRGDMPTRRRKYDARRAGKPAQAESERREAQRGLRRLAPPPQGLSHSRRGATRRRSARSTSSR